MELESEILINAPKEVVYAALNDPEILQQCIPGCQELTKDSDTELSALVVLKIGPVKAKFKGKVSLDPSEAPSKFSLSGEGNGGVAGFAKGGADVALEEAEEGTLLRYKAKAEIGGKLAQLGSRLVMSTAKKLSLTFFENLDQVLSGASKTDSNASENEEAPEQTAEETKKSLWSRLVR